MQSSAKNTEGRGDVSIVEKERNKRVLVTFPLEYDWNGEIISLNSSRSSETADSEGLERQDRIPAPVYTHHTVLYVPS